ncbi:MAG: 50S ribosomal protein L6 [Candidatus Nanohaloarchaea archaeon]
MKEEIQLPEEINAEYQDGALTLSNSGNEVSHKLDHALIDVNVENSSVSFESATEGKEAKSLLGTYRSHVENMITGLKKGYIYKLEGVYAHFPMDLNQEKDKILIENFMGEREPREIEIEDGVDVQINGEDVEIRGADKEAVGITAGRLEQACKKGDRDPRTFQDGVYITSRGVQE